MKNVLLVFIGFVVGTIAVSISTTHGVEKQLGKNEPVKVETKTEIKYFLGEKKECKDKGGLFQIDPDFTNYVMGTGYTDDYSVTCIKKYKEGNKSITETIFDYEI